MRRVILLIGLALIAAITIFTIRYISRQNPASPPSGGLARSAKESPVDRGLSAPAAPTELSKASGTVEVPWDQEIFFDDDGLIVHNKTNNGQWDGGDTAQREGFYWLGVWIRENILHKPWPYKRSLTFDQVLDLLRTQDKWTARRRVLPPSKNPSL